MSFVPSSSASTGAAGPTYSQPALPPTFTLDTLTLPRGRLHRVYWSGLDPLAPSRKATYRYDCPPSVPAANRYGVLYAGVDFETCWLETVVRSSIVRPAGAPISIPQKEMQARWACEIHVGGTLTIAKFADESLLDLGDSASNIMGDSYLRTQAWSQLLHAHTSPAIDGIQYRSRFKSSEFCIALFDRGITNGKLTVTNARSIDPATSAEIQSILGRYKVIPI